MKAASMACTCRGLGRCSPCAYFEDVAARVAARNAFRRAERAAVPLVDRLDALGRELGTLRAALLRHGALPRDF